MLLTNLHVPSNAALQRQCQLVLFYYCRHYLLTNFEDVGCVGCEVVLLGEWLLILQRILVSSSEG